MEPYDSIIGKLRAATPEATEQKLLDIVRDHDAEIVDLNLLQLMEGKDAKGEEIKPYYRSKLYADFKLTLNPRGVVDLKLTGNFHRSVFLNTQKFPVETSATDEKTNELISKYGREILDVPDDKKDHIAKDVVGPDVVDFFTAEVFNIP